MAFTFDDILPYLVSTYRRGVLIPFIGSGMSRPACTGWLDFLMKLATKSGVDIPDHLKTAGPKDKVDTSELYRLADKAVLGLASLDAAARVEVVAAQHGAHLPGRKWAARHRPRSRCRTRPSPGATARRACGPA